MCLSSQIKSISDFISFHCVKNHLLLEIKINCMNMLKKRSPVLNCIIILLYSFVLVKQSFKLRNCRINTNCLLSV